MAYTIAEFSEYNKAEATPELVDAQMRCIDCRVELRENVTGFRPTHEGPMCSDCYFGGLSAVIEQHPVGLPISRR